MRVSKAEILAKNTLIIGLGKLSSQFVGFILLPLYTHYLNPAHYGFVDLIVVYVALLVPALTMQLEMASFRFLVDARQDADERTRVISNVVYLVVPLTVPWLCLFVVIGLLINLPYMWHILALALATLFANLTLQITRGLGNNVQFATGSFIVGLATIFSAAIFLIGFDMQIDGMIISIAVSNFIGAVYLMLKMRLYRHIRIDKRDAELQREMVGYSAPLVLNGVSWWVINVSDRTIITTVISAAANGIYAISAKYSAIISSFNSVFNMAWMESASLHIDDPGRDKYFSQVANSVVRLSGSLGIGLIAFMPLLFPLMVGDDFYEAYQYIPILVASAFFNAIVGIYSAIYIAKKQTRQVMNTSIIAAIINIVLTVTLIPFFGIYAAAYATAISFLSMAVYRHYDVRKYVRITYDNHAFLGIVAMYAVTLFVYYYGSAWMRWAGVVSVILFSGWINRYEINRVKRMMFDGRVYRRDHKSAVRDTRNYR